MNNSHPKQPTVSLVIPGRNCAATLEKCLNSVVPLLERGELQEIIFVNDGSTDESGEIAGRFPVRVIEGRGKGAAAARNDGIEAASGEYVWCLDADCIAHADALKLLLQEFDSSQVAAVGGSLENANEGSLLAELIQDEISWRHAKMPQCVNFLASGNVVYRRFSLQETGGFDEGFRWAHDAELAYRFRSQGWGLRFCRDAIAEHHHFTHWFQYLGKQSAYATNRILLYRRYPDLVRGDDYSSWVDHLQPPLALAFITSLPFLLFPRLRLITLSVFVLLLICCFVTTVTLYRDNFRARTIAFLPFCIIRSMVRAIGACRGMLAVFFTRPTKSVPVLSQQEPTS